MLQERDLCLAYSRLLMIWPIVDIFYAQIEFPEILKCQNIAVLNSNAETAALEVLVRYVSLHRA